jgi:hypothetical protein
MPSDPCRRLQRIHVLLSINMLSLLPFLDALDEAGVQSPARSDVRNQEA